MSDLPTNEGKYIMKYTVRIIESERGWGQIVDEIKEFDSDDEAYEFVRKYNAQNNLDYVPDWYMYAQDPVRIEK